MKINTDIKYIKTCKKKLTPRFAKINFAIKSGTTRLKKENSKTSNGSRSTKQTYRTQKDKERAKIYIS